MGVSARDAAAHGWRNRCRRARSFGCAFRWDPIRVAQETRSAAFLRLEVRMDIQLRKSSSPAENPAMENRDTDRSSLSAAFCGGARRLLRGRQRLEHASTPL